MPGVMNNNNNNSNNDDNPAISITVDSLEYGSVREGRLGQVCCLG